MIEKRVKRALIDQWTHKNYPNGLYKLSVKSGIPASSLAKIRLGWVPKNERRLKDLADALEVSEDELLEDAS